jgi:hypothetical protein
MNNDEPPDDSALTAELVDCLADVAVPERPPLAAITGRGRVHRRRRLAGFAGLGGTGAAAVIALVLGLAGVFGAAPGGGTGMIQTADFTLTSYTNGNVALRLGQIFDPAALQQALEHHGIRALVKNDTYCSSSPAVPDSIINGVLPGSATPPHGAQSAHGDYGISMTANFPVKPSQLAPSVDPVTAVIDPAAIPSGTELFIGYYDLGHSFFLDLIYTGSHTCSIGQKPPALDRLDQPPSARHG